MSSIPLALDSGKVPVKCEADAANCTAGPKQPMVSLPGRANGTRADISISGRKRQ